ncbi:uncharacterized protein LOC131854419 [Achroia grisella]|uniref:uncharacterized protein LOC131854419 n=1 Tax=Achroia grisella TaxID=688607 RepID=UPI0027D2AFEF|nr:uncharacterized protein LOC131854419 [Achroia grisella]
MSSKSVPGCSGCKKALPKKEFLQCSICKGAYDLECANVSSKRYYSFYATDNDRRNIWKCPECLCKQPKRDNTDTPVRNPTPVLNTDMDIILSSSSVPCDDNINVTRRTKISKTTRAEEYSLIDRDGEDSLSHESDIGLVLSELRAIRQEMSTFRAAITNLTAAITSQNARLNSLETRLDAVETNKHEVSDCQDKDLRETVSQLKMEILERDQELLANDVEISGFPETPNENTIHIILSIANTLGVELEERDVVSAGRVGPGRAHLQRNGAMPPRPRPIAVRVTRRATRDHLLRAARVRRVLTTEGMGLSTATRSFYINERLTKHNRQLFYRAREFAHRCNWKYVWTRNGTIFARREHGGTLSRLRSDLDLKKIFGDDTVCAAS